jgi:hypothetical protein
MKVLLVEPPQSRKYYTGYAPLALLKISTYHKQRGDETKLIWGKWKFDGLQTVSNDLFVEPYIPDQIYITTLFTYGWRIIHETIQSVIDSYPEAPIKVGGIYATLCTDNLINAFGNRIEIHKGIWEDVDDMVPDYNLVPDWEISQVQTQRGCPRTCKFCYVRILEPEYRAKKSVAEYIMPNHKKITAFDNNILASPYWREIMEEFADTGKKIDFNSGLDCRIMTDEIIPYIKKMKIKEVRIAYDSVGVGEHVLKAVKILERAGIRRRDIICYCLFNYKDTPDDFHKRLSDLLNWGVTTYATRYEPPIPVDKHTHVGKHWTMEKLKMVSKAKAAVGSGGAFPPKQEAIDKIAKARDFNKAMKNVLEDRENGLGFTKRSHA